MSWLQLKIETSNDYADELSERLSEHGALSVTLADAADQALFEPDPGATPLWTSTCVIGLFETASDIPGIIEQLRQTLPPTAPFNWHTEALADQDWERNWMERYQPMDFGHGLWICPSWHTAPEQAKTSILLDPGLAFGTGTHATTALCLEWLAQAQLDGLDVVDYGCGSGILAIAALKRGAARAWGVDNDPQALVVSRENAAKNAVAEHYQGYLPEQLPTNLQADLLIANILLGPLLKLAPRLSALLKPGGRLLLSGILDEQSEQIRLHYGDGFMFTEQARDHWVLLTGTKSARNE